MKHIIIRLTIILSIILLGCEEQQLSYPSTWGRYTPTEEELTELISRIEKEFESGEEQWN